METKMEVDPADDLETTKIKLFNLVKAYDNGISEAELSRTMDTTSAQTRMNAVNALTNEGKIQLCKRGSDLYYRALDPKISTNHSAILGANISIEERAVYQVVESAGSKGIWNREIRNQTKLPLNQMSKVLKNLETKKLIKAVKSVTASKKKLYMLFGLEPDKSVTGGAWYSGTEFESEYVQILYEQCYHFVKKRLTSAASITHQEQTIVQDQQQQQQQQMKKDDGSDFVKSRDLSLVSSAEVKDYIEELKISNVKLSLQDIEMVLETIVFDGLVEKISVVKEGQTSIPVKSESKGLTSDEEEGDGLSNITHYYRALPKLVESSAIMRVPCGQCPYVHECRPGAVITAEKCLYFERWFLH